MNTITKKEALDFLICCYFGQSEDLGRAAIDRAYVDMAAHTISNIPQEKRNEYRYKASTDIKKALLNYGAESDFGKWHCETIRKIKSAYKDDLTEGQAQKWLNMTIKYLYTFEVLCGEDSRLIEYRIIKDIELLRKYKIVIDSAVISNNKITSLASCWSKLEKKEYDNLDRVLRNKNKNFVTEYRGWNQYKNNRNMSKPEKNSYAEYYDKSSKEY